MSLPAINEGVHCWVREPNRWLHGMLCMLASLRVAGGQRHYMGQIVMGMKPAAR